MFTLKFTKKRHIYQSYPGYLLLAVNWTSSRLLGSLSWLRYFFSNIMQPFFAAFISSLKSPHFNLEFLSCSEHVLTYYVSLRASNSRWDTFLHISSQAKPPPVSKCATSSLLMKFLWDLLIFWWAYLNVIYRLKYKMQWTWGCKESTNRCDMTILSPPTQNNEYAMLPNTI